MCNWLFFYLTFPIDLCFLFFILETLLKWTLLFSLSPGFYSLSTLNPTGFSYISSFVLFEHFISLLSYHAQEWRPHFWERQGYLKSISSIPLYWRYGHLSWYFLLPLPSQRKDFSFSFQVTSSICTPLFSPPYFSWPPFCYCSHDIEFLFTLKVFS